MTKHDCPYCHCNEEPECADGHCMHLGGASYPAQVWFCCRCPYTDITEVDLSGGNSSWPPEGCKLELTVC